MSRSSLLALLTLTLLAGVVPVAADGSEPVRDATVIAHRGASAYAPENTLPAVDLGIDMGAPLVEIDIQLSADREIVVLHDTTLGRTTDVEDHLVAVDPRQLYPHVAFFHSAELAELDAGCWGRFADSEYCGTHVPTLAETLDLFTEHPDVGLLIEVKSPAEHPGIEPLLVAELQARVAAGETNLHVVQSFDWQSMQRFDVLQQRAGLDYPVGLLGTVNEADFDTYAWAEQVNPNHGSLTAEYVAAAHAAGFSVNPYTVNDACRMLALIDDIGVDGVITDRPDLMQRVLAPDTAMQATLETC